MSTEDRRIELARVSDILAWKMLSDCSQINLDNVVQSKVTDTLTTPAEIYGIARKECWVTQDVSIPHFGHTGLGQTSKDFRNIL